MIRANSSVKNRAASLPDGEYEPAGIVTV